MKRLAKELSFHLYRLAGRAGIHILPAHYYVPVADVKTLKKTRPLWARKSALPGLRVDLTEQAKNLKRICLPYQAETAGNATFLEAVGRHFGPGYGYIEAQALHAIIRNFQPRRVIEVGCGVSSYCMLKALEINERNGSGPFHLVCIEPYPSDALRRLDRIERIETPVQSVPMETFAALGDGDLLFIDSTHAVKPGSDVNYLILEVLPRLNPGVIVHFHDIYLPYDYPRDVLRTYFQWMETSLLRAFLTHNDHAQIMFCMSHLHYERQDVLKEVFPEYRPAPDEDGLEVKELVPTHFPSSLYFRTR